VHDKVVRTFQQVSAAASAELSRETLGFYQENP